MFENNIKIKFFNEKVLSKFEFIDQIQNEQMIFQEVKVISDISISGSDNPILLRGNIFYDNQEQSTFVININLILESNKVEINKINEI